MADSAPLLREEDDIDVEAASTIELPPYQNFFEVQGEKKKIDFVLVFEEEHKRSKPTRLLSESEREEKMQKMDLAAKQAKWRKRFLRNLVRKGVIIKTDENVSVDKTIKYYLLHIPWELLIYYAEDLNLRAPLQLREYRTRQWSAKFLSGLRLKNMMELNVPNYPSLYFTCTFRQSKLKKFLGSDDKENYFRDTDRQRIAWEILEVTVYGKKRRGEIGFYTSWLLPVSILGLVIFLTGFVSFSTNPTAQQVCNSSNNFIMCPLCDTCKNWTLDKTCFQARLSYLFDHSGTVMFAVIMSLWAVLFLEYWKRKNANLAHHWEVMDFHEEERPRPEYAALAPEMEKNRVTGVIEPHFPKGRRLRRMLTGFTILIIMLVVVVIFVISVILYKSLMGIILLHSGEHLLQVQAGSMGSATGALLNLILIMLMAQVYTVVAQYLTRWEMHRTQTEYENSFTFKVFIFQFVNYYSSIFYIAFFKGNLTGYPGHYRSTLGVRNEGCGGGGCLIELAQQLVVIMVGKQTINNIQELVFPKLKQWWNRQRLKNIFGRTALKKPWDHDYSHLIQYDGLFDEYLEMVLQFGFITIFVGAFPIAPIFALLNNWIEIRLDAKKLVCETRKPVGDRAQNIGVWFSILDGIVQIAVIVNAFTIAFTTDFIPRAVYTYFNDHGSLDGYVNFTLAYAPYDSGLGDCRYHAFRDRDGHYTMEFWVIFAIRLVFVICFEHVVFFVGRMIDWIVPDVPESLEFKIKREHYLAKQALADNQNSNLEVLKLYHRPDTQSEKGKYEEYEDPFIPEVPS